MLHLLLLRPKKTNRTSSFHLLIACFSTSFASAHLPFTLFFCWCNTGRSSVLYCTFFCQFVLKHTMHGILHCTATSLPCLCTLACWPCLAGGRAVHRGTSKSLIYFFHFQRQIVPFLCLSTFPGAYHPPLPHHPSLFFSFQVLWQLTVNFFFFFFSPLLLK